MAKCIECGTDEVQFVQTSLPSRMEPAEKTPVCEDHREEVLEWAWT